MRKLSYNALSRKLTNEILVHVVPKAYMEAGRIMVEVVEVLVRTKVIQFYTEREAAIE